MNKKIFALSALFLLVLTACGGNSNPSSSVVSSSNPESQQPQGPEEAIVFVLSGQSNMEGNTSWDATQMETAFNDLGLNDPGICETGINEVVTSTYCAGYGQLDHTKLDTNTQVGSTNTENRFQGKFLPTAKGMGLNSSKFGPELGCAYGLKSYGTANKPIFFIKMASGGSGFEQNTQYNWPARNEDGGIPEINLYSTFCKPFVENNLRIIEEEYGFKPVIKGWLWHQGESDTGAAKTAKYAERLELMVDLFRTDFSYYATNEDGNNIAFVDGMICEEASWSNPKDMNAEKQKFADSNPNNYLVNTYANDEAIDSNKLTVGGDRMHYDVKSEFRLGLGYAKVIIENNLLG